MAHLPVFGPDDFPDLINDLNGHFDHTLGRVLLLDRPLDPDQAHVIKQLDHVICFAVKSEFWLQTETWPDYICGGVSDPNNAWEISWALEEAKRVLDLRFESEKYQIELRLQERRLEEVMNSSMELTEERDFKKLCDKALSRMRRLIRAEGASLYIIDPKQNNLRFVALQNERVESNWNEKRIPIDETSYVGAAVIRKEMIFIRDLSKCEHDNVSARSQEFDRENQFETRSLLTLPLIRSDQEVVGVVQLVNCQGAEKMSDAELRLAQSFSNHVGAALDNVLLNQNIEQLFEGFIQASVVAIEARDPTTSGHSERVAELTLGIAQAVHESRQKCFKNIRFQADQLKEIRYASLLHDFGKIGVPEQVLIKEKKLFPHQLDSLRLRMQLFKKAFPERAKEFDSLWNDICQANEPAILNEKVGEALRAYTQEEITLDGEKFAVLHPSEWELLSIPKGSLSSKERAQIQSHVEHSYRFLSQIPWTKPLSRVAEIAGAHHEKLNGQGYPRGLKQEEIPFESQMMAVADVFDALTAMDRPYKKAVSTKRALEILQMEVKSFALNSDLVELFEQQSVFRLIKLNQ